MGSQTPIFEVNEWRFGSSITKSKNLVEPKLIHNCAYKVTTMNFVPIHRNLPTGIVCNL